MGPDVRGAQRQVAQLRAHARMTYPARKQSTLLHDLGSAASSSVQYAATSTMCTMISAGTRKSGERIATSEQVMQAARRSNRLALRNPYLTVQGV